MSRPCMPAAPGSSGSARKWTGSSMGHAAVARGADGRRAKITELYREVVGAGRLDRLDDLVAPAYVPHVPEFRGIAPLESGRDALRARLSHLGRRSHRVARLIVDGDCGFAHVCWDGPPSAAG